jgi:hypothetical protein
MQIDSMPQKRHTSHTQHDPRRRTDSPRKSQHNTPTIHIIPYNTRDQQQPSNPIRDPRRQASPIDNQGTNTQEEDAAAQPDPPRKTNPASSCAAGSGASQPDTATPRPHIMSRARMKKPSTRGPIPKRDGRGWTDGQFRTGAASRSPRSNLGNGEK